MICTVVCLRDYTVFQSTSLIFQEKLSALVSNTEVVFAVFVFNQCGFFHTCVGIPKQVIFSKADLKMFLTSDIAWSPLK